RSEAREDDLRIAPAREPAVAEVDDPLEGVPGLTPDEDGRVRLLHGFRIGEDRIEVHVVTVELRLLLGPDLLHGQGLLAEDRVARLVDGAVILHLVLVPAGPDTQLEAPAR